LSRVRCTAWAIVVLALIAGCGHTSASRSDALASKGAADGGSSPPHVLPSAGSCAPGTRTRCITANDEGRTITVRVGETFTLELKASGRSFGEPTESGAKALELIGASRSGSAAEAYYRAVSIGRIWLRAPERPLCRRGRACPMFIELWQVQVRVVR
jgi:hypothetical protein